MIARMTDTQSAYWCNPQHDVVGCQQVMETLRVQAESKHREMNAAGS